MIITKNTPKKGTKKAETLKFFEHFDCFLIGVTGFEPAASWSRTKHSTGLSHTPIAIVLYHKPVALSIAKSKFFSIFIDLTINELALYQRIYSVADYRHDDACRNNT